MHRPLAFHAEARLAVERASRNARGPAKFVGLRQVNVVAHVATRPGRPTRWSGFSPRRVPPHNPKEMAVPMQSRSSVIADGTKSCTMLVFNEEDPDIGRLMPTSTIVAGASAVPIAIEMVLSQESRCCNEVVAVFNTVVAGRIEAPGLTLEGLRAHPQSIVTNKFPGESVRPREANHKALTPNC